MPSSFYLYFMTFTSAFLGVLIYNQPYLFGGLTYFLGISLLFLMLVFFRRNFLFQLRIILLSVIGFYAATVKLINKDSFFSPVGFLSQGYEIVALMFALTLVAISGAALGFHIFFKAPENFNVIRELGGWVKNLIRIRIVFVLTLIGIGFLSAQSYGDSVFVSVYASGTGAGQSIGNLQAIGVVLLVICAINSNYNNRYFAVFIFVLIVYYLGWGIFIRGGRMEVVSGFLALLVAIPCVRGEIFRISLKSFFVMVIAVIFLEAWGSLRSSLSVSNEVTESIFDGYIRLYKAGVYHAGTVSGIGTTFSNIIHMVEYDIIGFYYGLSYIQYILRTPPAFIYPSRPQDLSGIFEAFGYESMGGFFELSEAFLNFGIIGCFFIPFLISGMIARMYQAALRGSLFWFICFTSILSVFFRGIWYQTFALYKMFVTGIVIFIVVVVALSIVKALRVQLR